MATRARKKVRHEAAKVARRRKVRAVIRKRPPLAPATLQSYEDMLLSHILRGGGKNMVTEYALLLNSLVSSLSSAMMDMSYRSGISVGRALYRMYSRSRRYEWYEESVRDLVTFLERTGHNHITYAVHPDMIEITMHHRKEADLGVNMHTFECGLVSGFLSAARHGIVHVNETECANNGAEFCRFVTSGNALRGAPDLGAVGKFFDFFSGSLNEIERRRTELEHTPEEYYLLASLPLMDRSFTKETKEVVLHLGGALGSRMEPTRANFERVMSILGLGKLKVISMNPLRANVTYDRLRARSEFINVSVSFLDGLLSGKTKGMIDVDAHATANAYKVTLTERKASR